MIDMSEYILEMKGITKLFPGVKALDDVSFKVRRGEIHCLVGENGAGKSTLMKVLSGVYPYGSYSGDIIFDGRPQSFSGIADSERAGISIIYQELALFPELAVYENIFIGHEIKKGLVIDWNETIAKSADLLKKVRLNINPTTQVKQLGVGAKQLVEIAKALSKETKLLILDEPTAALSEDDSQNLLRLLRELKALGITCIMISHKLKEIIAIADTITILRDGRTVASMDAARGGVNENEIIKHMVGREIGNIYPARRRIAAGEDALEVRGWNVFDPEKGRAILHDINIRVKKGEIVGLAGLLGAGRTEFALSIFGNVPGYTVSGEIFINGEKKKLNSPGDSIESGLCYVTEDRKKNGLILIQDIKSNITISNLNLLSKYGVINQNEEIDKANWYMHNVHIKAPSIAQIVGNLSGGNQQKTSLAKWLFASPNTLILDEPTRGIDVGAKYEIYCLMNDLVEQGMSIIMISSELLEILGMSDRIYVVSEGRVVGEMPVADATEEKIMKMAVATI